MGEKEGRQVRGGGKRWERGKGRRKGGWELIRVGRRGGKLGFTWQPTKFWCSSDVTWWGNGPAVWVLPEIGKLAVIVYWSASVSCPCGCLDYRYSALF